MLMLVLAAALAQADPPPVLGVPSPLLDPGVRAMIEAAIASDDRQAVEVVVRLARSTNPGAGPEIDRLEDGFRRRLAETERAEADKRREQLATAGTFDNWKGQIELGASRSTGNTDSSGFYGALGLERNGLDWRHKVTARADFQQTNDVTTTQRALVSWQPNYRVDDRLYGFGLAQYEYDPLLGYDNRYTLSGGLGYSVIARPKVKLELEGGPAFRLTDPVTGGDESSVAGRASMNFGWQVSPTLELKQQGAVYYEAGRTSANSQTALDATLIGSLKGRLSYNVQYESAAPVGSESVDTSSRATLIYNF